MMAAIHHFTISLVWVVSPNIITGQKGKRYQGIKGTKAFECKIQKVISNTVINEKNEEMCQTTGITGNQVAFSDKVTPDIDVFY